MPSAPDQRRIELLRLCSDLSDRSGLIAVSQINALIAPRPELAVWGLKRYEAGHFETLEMRHAVIGILKQWL